MSGPIVMIGFGSIGRGTLPLIDRHLDFDRTRAVVVEPDDRDRGIVEEYGLEFIQTAVTVENYRDLLTPLLTEGEGQGFCVNLSVDTSSLDIMRLCRELGVLYIDTVVEPWPGFYYDKETDNATRTNQALRSTVIDERRQSPGGTTAISCCGANPGMVSWFVKEALVTLASDLGVDVAEPAVGDSAGWAEYMRTIGVRGIHIAERDTQRTRLAEADRHVLEHVVGRRVHLRRAAARRARLGHPRELDARQRPHLRRPVGARASSWNNPAPRRGCAPGVRRTASSTGSS